MILPEENMRNILVFEKERIVCLDIKTIFSNKGFNVVFGRSIHDIAGQEVDPVLVILDILSYELFCKEGLWSCLGYSSASEVPLILSFSGIDTTTEDEIMDELNVIGKVMKPYDSNQLIDIYKTYQDKEKANLVIK